MEKARDLACDGVILDLEDSVAPDLKSQARERVVAAVVAGGFGPREVIIRINGAGSPWHADDLAAAGEAAPDAILVPKVESPDDILGIGRSLRPAPPKTAIWAMIETPAAILHAAAIAAAARDDLGSRLGAFVLGLNDLAKETGARMLPGRANMLPWIGTALLAARAEGLAAIDAVFNGLDDPKGLDQECAQARDLGFDGKSLIHPRQIEIANRVFAPSSAEIAEARAIVELFRQPGNEGSGAVARNGHMVERLHAEMAARTLALARAIAFREGHQ
jgi:citrate lyase subunit beta/citryl-CoA lyase